MHQPSVQKKYNREIRWKIHAIFSLRNAVYAELEKAAGTACSGCWIVLELRTLSIKSKSNRWIVICDFFMVIMIYLEVEVEELGSKFWPEAKNMISWDRMTNFEVSYINNFEDTLQIAKIMIKTYLNYFQLFESNNYVRNKKKWYHLGQNSRKQK